MEKFVTDNRKEIVKFALKRVIQKLHGLRKSLEEASATAPNEALTNFRLLRKLLTGDGSANTGKTSIPYEQVLAKNKVRDLLNEMVKSFDNLLIKEENLVKTEEN
jgi:hypothetical protein